ncbi:hypothetical protein PTKIN_Ptkin13bG0180400 [Pterospermum kingtungense]
MVRVKGQSSSSSRAGEVVDGPKKRSPLTIATLKIIKERADRRVDRKKPGCRILYFDNTDLGYGWLLPGWVVEHRYVPSGRLYKYFYDPAGHQYRSQSEVLSAWDQAGMVCLDF